MVMVFLGDLEHLFLAFLNITCRLERLSPDLDELLLHDVFVNLTMAW